MFGPCAKIFLFSLLVAVATGGFARKLSTSDKSNRVINGDHVHISKRPFLCQLRIRDSGDFVCGSSLVTPTYLVTAKHCTRDIDPLTELDVVCGANTKERSGVKGKIIAEHAHPRFLENGTKAFDITILELNDPMEGKNIATIDISYDIIKDGAKLTVTGFGVTENGPLDPKGLARTARVSKISDEECSKKFNFAYTMMCLGTPGKGACYGDSGGPATYNGKLAGVVSFNAGCDHSDSPDVYTSTRSVRDFLESYIHK